MRDDTRCREQQAVRVDWTLGDGSALTLMANFSAAPVAAPAVEGRVLWQEGEATPQELAPWTAIFTLREGGERG